MIDKLCPFSRYAIHPSSLFTRCLYRSIQSESLEYIFDCSVNRNFSGKVKYQEIEQENYLRHPSHLLEVGKLIETSRESRFETEIPGMGKVFKCSTYIFAVVLIQKRPRIRKIRQLRPHR